MKTVFGSLKTPIISLLSHLFSTLESFQVSFCLEVCLNDCPRRWSPAASSWPCTRWTRATNWLRFPASSRLQGLFMNQDFAQHFILVHNIFGSKLLLILFRLDGEWLLFMSNFSIASTLHLKVLLKKYRSIAC
jgi:hypothetical protein